MIGLDNIFNYLMKNINLKVLLLSLLFLQYGCCKIDYYNNDNFKMIVRQYVKGHPGYNTFVVIPAPEYTVKFEKLKNSVIVGIGYKDMLDYFKWEKDTFLDVDTSRVYFLKYTDKHNNGFNYGDWENHNPKDSICLSCEYYVTGGRENMYYRGIMVTFKKGKMFIVNNPYYLFFYRRVKSNIIFQVPMI